jgi:acryloyl-coenzyme A reductase
LKAIVLEAFGGPDVLRLVDLPKPSPKPGQVLVRIEAAGICHHDVMHRAGKLPGARIGVVLGHEAAGTVVEVGAGAPAELLGARVVVYQRQFCGHCRDCLRGRQDMCRSSSQPAVDVEGGNAEFIAIDAKSVIPVPPQLAVHEAALACCPIATSVRALTQVAHLQPGDSVLVTGASGGLGAHQLQIIRALGGRAIAVTGSAAKAARLRELGAADVVVTEDGRFGDAVWRLTGKRGVDIAIDNVGNRLEELLRCVTFGGTAVVLGNIEGKPGIVSPGLLIGRRITVAGSGMGTPEDVRRALAMMANGQVKPVISAVLPFAEIARGHAMLDERQVEGRVVLEGW